jgi:hypothetical protein
MINKAQWDAEIYGLANKYQPRTTMQITFNHTTKNGVLQSTGELIDKGIFQYALHQYQGYYDAIELSTGLAVASIPAETRLVDGISPRAYLLQQIEKRTITEKVLESGKALLKACNIDYPVNEPFKTKTK